MLSTAKCKPNAITFSASSSSSLTTIVIPLLLILSETQASTPQLRFFKFQHLVKPKMVDFLSILLITWLLFLPHHGTKAQSPTQPVPPFVNHHKMWDPSIAVVTGALIGTFLLVAVFSLYLRRCTQQRSNHQCSCRCGIHPELLHTFPTLFFSTIKHLRLGKGTLECAVCLTEFTDTDTLRLLPQCNHVFHPPCIDQWLSSHVTCPVCRANLNQDFDHVPILVPAQLNINETNVEASGSRAEAEQGSGESEIERCPVALDASEGQRKSDEDKGVRDRASKSKLVRSNSTGHSVVEAGECLERYTLRLPEDVRKYILLNHGVMQRSASYNVVMVPRKGFCWSDSEGSSGSSSKRNGVGMRSQGSVTGKNLT